MNDRAWRLGVVASCVVVGLLAAGAAAQSPQPASSPSLNVVCVAEQPAIVEGENVTLYASATRADGPASDRPLTLVWRSGDGPITVDGTRARWNLAAVTVPRGETRAIVHATVDAADDRGSAGQCTVEVFVGRPTIAPPDRGSLSESLITAKRFLLPGQSEEPGYGLYSYLLFSAPPADDEEKARYLKTIEACLVVLQDVDAYLQRHVRPSRLNATFIPLTATPRAGQSNAEWAANVLAAYDYTAAQVLLGSLQGAYRRGPYLVSVLGPLSAAPGRVYLLEELTGIVPELVADRIKFFSYLAAQQRSWSDEALQRFALNLRNLVAVGGKVAPDAVRGVIDLVPFKRGA